MEFTPRPFENDNYGGKRFKEERVTCLFCSERLPWSSHRPHYEKRHSWNQFKCLGCSELFPFLPEILRHLIQVHGLEHLANAAECINGADLKQWISLPEDLRGLKCRMCVNPPKYYLSQDRSMLQEHLEVRHGIRVNRNGLAYTCRSCEEEFNDTPNFFLHACYTGMKEDKKPKLAVEEGENRRQTEEAEEVIRCLYCEETVSTMEKASHRAKHWQLDFGCPKCSRSFVEFEDARSHANNTHDFEVENIKEVLEKKAFNLPVDLRSLKCPDCDFVFLAQDRRVLISHLRREHGHSEVIDKSEFTYSCRACGLENLQDSLAVASHEPCCPREIVEGKKEEFIDLSHVKFEPPQNKGDCRRLVCRLCGFQSNGTRFFIMIQHLETVHHKSQVSRDVVLEDFVLFGCANCGTDDTSNLHLWEKHFNRDFTNCKDSLTPTQETETLKIDLRMLSCVICGESVNKTKFRDMIDHLQSKHPNQIDRNLENFVVFGCSNCPNLEVNSVPQWDKHFYKSYLYCKDSYRKTSNISA